MYQSSGTTDSPRESAQSSQPTADAVEGTMDASPSNDPSEPVSTGESTKATVAVDDDAPGDLGSTVVDFKHELARAMRSAAEAERDRIATSVAATAQAHLEKVRARSAAEADGFRQLADEDVDRIREWSKAEVARIHDEAESRIGARRQQLDRHIEQHGSITEREIASVERALEQYRSELDQFFARLAGEEDPAEFATLAASMPGPPDLDEIGGEARTRALDEIRAVESAGEAPAAGMSSQSDQPPTAFSPAQPGPELVGVMAPAEAPMADEADTAAEPGPGEAAAEPVAAGPAESTAIMGQSDAELPGDDQAAANGTLHRLRVLAGLSNQKRED
jgi:hypothetical protein